MSSLRRVVALFLLAWMPLEALAVPLLTWHCAAHDTPALMFDDGDIPCASHAGTPALPDPDDASGNEPPPAKAGDFCCSHFSAVPAALVVASAERPPFEAPPAGVVAFSFVLRPLTQPPRG